MNIETVTRALSTALKQQGGAILGTNFEAGTLGLFFEGKTFAVSISIEEANVVAPAAASADEIAQKNEGTEAKADDVGGTVGAPGNAGAPQAGDGQSASLVGGGVDASGEAAGDGAAGPAKEAP